MSFKHDEGKKRKNTSNRMAFKNQPWNAKYTCTYLLTRSLIRIVVRGRREDELLHGIESVIKCTRKCVSFAN